MMMRYILNVSTLLEQENKIFKKTPKEASFLKIKKQTLFGLLSKKLIRSKLNMRYKGLLFIEQYFL